MKTHLFSLLFLFVNFIAGYADIEVPKSAGLESKDCSRCHNKNNLFAQSGFSVTNPDLWYTINPVGYPIVVPLSLTRNNGFRKGHIKLTSTGIKICKSGDYRVSFITHLTNPTPASTAIIPVFLVRNGSLVINDSQVLGVTVSLPTDIITPVQAYGILKNVKAGTILSLVASNGAGADAVPLKVVSWVIYAERICNPKQ